MIPWLKILRTKVKIKNPKHLLPTAAVMYFIFMYSLHAFTKTFKNALTELLKGKSINSDTMRAVLSAFLGLLKNSLVV